MHNFWFASVKPALQKSVVFQTEICCYNKTFWFFSKTSSKQNLSIFSKTEAEIWLKRLNATMNWYEREKERESLLWHKETFVYVLLWKAQWAIIANHCAAKQQRKKAWILHKKVFFVGLSEKVFFSLKLVWHYWI